MNYALVTAADTTGAQELLAFEERCRSERAISPAQVIEALSNALAYARSLEARIAQLEQGVFCGKRD